ncbi:uncharacterized protein LOC118356221 [Zalophus californianus]|uniref:Uncharacterized protein LOC118356221 n=1 Tax=Zalophus californianus TaxID=9704 RepID=A0A6P9F2D9_ZALCA|nr:uncharacterized protein LOC118356221 [Zalophus californianus]
MLHPEVQRLQAEESKLCKHSLAGDVVSGLPDVSVHLAGKTERRHQEAQGQPPSPTGSNRSAPPSQELEPGSTCVPNSCEEPGAGAESKPASMGLCKHRNCHSARRHHSPARCPHCPPAQPPCCSQIRHTPVRAQPRVSQRCPRHPAPVFSPSGSATVGSACSSWVSRRWAWCSRSEQGMLSCTWATSCLRQGTSLADRSPPSLKSSESARCPERRRWPWSSGVGDGAVVPAGLLTLGRTWLQLPSSQAPGKGTAAEDGNASSSGAGFGSVAASASTSTLQCLSLCHLTGNPPQPPTAALSCLEKWLSISGWLSLWEWCRIGWENWCADGFALDLMPERVLPVVGVHGSELEGL